MRFSALVSVAALSVAVSASPTRRQEACATQCDFEQKFCAFRESPDCAIVCTAAEYNKWVACHACQLEAGNAAEADALKGAIARLAAGCLSTGNSLTGGPTSELSTATAAAKPATSSAPADAVVDAAEPSGSGSAAVPSGSASAPPSGSSAASAAPSASAPAATPTSGAVGRAAPLLAGVAGVAVALLA